VTRMSGFLGQRVRNLGQFRRFRGPVQILLHWTFWATFWAHPGCVVPLSPEFEDLPSAPNYPPHFTFYDPYIETPTMPQPFTVRVIDPNPDDILYVRWVSDYPPFVQGVSKLIIDGVTLLPSPVRKDSNPSGVVGFNDRATEYDAGPKATGPACGDFTRFDTGADHKLVVIVSDRPFLSPLLNNSTFRYNQVQGDPNFTLPPIMAGWTVERCP
jgi:hypothetical protein